MSRELGLEKGKVFPAAHARSLLNPARRLLQSPRRIVGHLGLTPGDRVLEVGPGPGWFSPTLAASVPDGCVVLVDVQVEMLRFALDRLADHTRVLAAQGDAAALPLPDGSVDAALVVAMLGEVPEPTEAIAELARVVRPGGVLVVAETRTDSDFIRLDALRRMVEPRGFAFADRRGRPWEYHARFIRR